MSYEICPWCQTDIIWDEEIGREDMCPHCFNELKDYRSIQLHEKINESSKLNIHEEIEEEEEIDEATRELLEQIEDEPQDLINYEQTVEAYKQVQKEFLECLHCHESMIYAGQQTFDNNQYRPVIPTGLSVPFLKVPYTVDVHICPVCFEVRSVLSETDRMEIIQKLI